MRMNAFREAAEIVNQKNQRRLIVGETELKNILNCVKDDILTPGNKDERDDEMMCLRWLRLNMKKFG